MKKEKSKLFNRWLIILSIVFLGSCATHQGVGNTREAARSQKYSQQRTWSQFNSIR